MHKASRLTSKQHEVLTGYIFVLPYIIGLLVFVAGPMLFSLYTSFTNYNITSKMDFIGLDNYITMFTKDPLYWQTLGNTLYFVLFGVPLVRIFAILLAVLLNNQLKGMRVFRTIFYLPSVLSGVAVFLLWMQLFSPTSGLVNRVLGLFGIQGPAWLFDPLWTKPALILMGIWGAGGSMLLYLARLQSVPQHLYESAELDGANAVQKFFKITLPLISPVIFFDLITGMIGAFQVFQSAYVMTRGIGGPLNSLLFYNFYMWQKGFKSFDMGYATAMAWVLFVIIMSITLLNLLLSKLWVHYEGGDGE